MRILILDTWYPEFLVAFYAANPGLEDEAYAPQWQALMESGFGTSDAYSHHLRLLGHEAHEIVTNCDPAQHAWELEQGIRVGLTEHASQRRRRRATLRAQVRTFAPDLLYVQDMHAFPPELLRDLADGRPVVGQIASELPDPSYLAPYRLVMTSFPHFVERIRHFGVEALYLPLAFDTRVLGRLGNVPLLCDVGFVGSLLPTQHDRGNRLLAGAAQQIDIDFWGRGGGAWPADSPVARRYRGPAWGMDMYRVLAGSRIALNRHIDVAGDCANNMRLYEATGVGTLLLTDAKQNLHELFEPGSDIVTYRSEAELVDRARYYLEHDDERARIAAAGQRRTLSEHTYEARMRELVSVLSSCLG